MSGATSERRVLGWDACTNARDIGGYPTNDGRTTRWAALVRSDDLARLSAPGHEALRAYGVRTVIDVRSSAEASKAPSPYADDAGIAYLNLAIREEDPHTPDRQLRSIYAGILEENAPAVARILSAIASAPDGGVLVHCYAGKDRTGIVVALALAVAGVPDEVIASDYALSAECLAPRYDEWLERVPAEQHERVRETMIARPETIASMLADVRERYGSVERYLAESGLSEADLARLRARLVA